MNRIRLNRLRFLPTRWANEVRTASLRITRWAILLIAVATLLPTVAQDEAMPSGSGALRISINDFPSSAMLLPLFATDGNGRVIPASDENPGLVLDWTFIAHDLTSSDGEIHAQSRIDLSLNDRLTWADGTPITAYDVYFTDLYLAGSPTADLTGKVGTQSSDSPIAVVPTAPDQLSLYFDHTNCASLEQYNLLVYPAHISDPAFADKVIESFRGKNVLDVYREWRQHTGYTFLPFRELSFRLAPGAIQLIDADPDGTLYLEGGDLNITLVQSSDTVNEFISGDLDILFNPPFNRRADLYALPDVQIVEQVGRTWYALGFNAADSREPKSAFDPETGEPLEQGVNLYFGDIRVRRAIEMALDVDAIGTAVTSGYFTRLAGDQLPYSWAFNPSLTFTDYTPLEAGLLLDEAGWRDWDRNGIRECHGCLTAEEGTPMTFSLNLSSDQTQDVIARMIREQLARIGVEAFTEITGETNQAFDAYILQVDEGYPIAADRGALFRRSEDVHQQGANVTSVVDPQLDELFATAARAPQCDYAVRAEALMEASEVIRENLYYLPLFAVNDLYVAQGAVEGFAPRQNDPFWNMSEWVINR